jgi:uncharacterized protein YyaL (SSP411 family)
MQDHKHTNALAGETSPYLLQHAHNPVDWHPWNDAALRRAVEEDKPILLSIGYSACHWCHVMERESFENEDIAGLMNHDFVNIKVDREERPDLDAIYMKAVQLISGSGGWPLTVFLTPDLIPFYGGTYFPPEDRYGMPGFPHLLQTIARAYRQNKSGIKKSAAEVMAGLEQNAGIGGAGGRVSPETLDEAVSRLISAYDQHNGGFGGAPKFPPSMALSFLLRTHSRTKDPQLLAMVEQTLRKMAWGGIYDQLGGGFHRYATDADWLVPHFEKMLYDNALLSRIYLDAYLVTKNEFYREIAEQTLDYVQIEMTSPEGGFYSTQDADSEGHEGKFFVWTPSEIESVLGAQDSRPFCHYFGVTEDGNFEGKNILHIDTPLASAAEQCGISEEQLREIIVRGRQLLFQAREHRIKPARDEKVLTAWNGLMLRSFAEAANALRRDDYRRTAIRNAEFILARLQRDGRLLRSFKDGAAKFNAYLEDYAALADALLALYEATFDLRWMREAERIGNILIDQFHDSSGSGFYFTSVDHEPLIERPKEYFDNAMPSGNSMAAFSLLRLWRFSGDPRWLKPAESVLDSLSSALERFPSGFGNFLCAADFYLGKPKEIAVVGDGEQQATRDLLGTVFTRYLPNKVVACGRTDDLFLLRNREQIAGQPTAYVCENYTCLTPVTNPQALEQLLATS